MVQKIFCTTLLTTMYSSILISILCLVLVGEATAGVVAAVKSGASMTEESSMTSLFWFMQY